MWKENEFFQPQFLDFYCLWESPFEGVGKACSVPVAVFERELIFPREGDSIADVKSRLLNSSDECLPVAMNAACI